MRFAQWLGGLRVEPALGVDMRRLSANAGDLGKGFEQLVLHALRVVLQVLLRPGRAGLHRPALHRAAAWFAGFTRQPSDTVVRAARGIPLWAQRRQVGLHGLGKGQHHRPARSHFYRVKLCRHRTGFLQARQQVLRLRCGNGKQYTIKARVNVLRVVNTRRSQLPLRRVQRVRFNGGDFGWRFKLLALHQRLCPGFDQGIHSRCGHPMRLARGQARSGHPAKGIKHLYCVGTPAFANARYGLQSLGKARIAHREVLRTVVERSKRAAACGHAPS